MKRTFIITSILVILGSLGYSSYVAHSMYEKYNETIQWKNSSSLSNIHQVPPSLAKNYISSDEHELFQVLTDVNIALEEIKELGEIKDEKYNEYWDLHDKAESVIEDSNIESSDIFNDFSLYLKADLSIKKAYDELDVESLDEYAKTFSNRLLKEDNKLERAFLKELHKISADYRELNNFSRNAIAKLGVVEDNVLHVDIKVNRQITDELLKEIESNKLTKFAHIRNLVDTLNSNSWDKILAHNSSSLEYYSWKESRDILEGLLASDYIAVSSFETVKDVLAYDPSIKMEEKPNFTINKDSIVTGVYHNGEKLNEDLYVKRGAILNFSIDYKYTENPKSTVVVEYVDIDGNKLNVTDETYTGYVGNSVNIPIKNIDGYTFVKINNGVNKFPNKNSTVQIIYEEYVPEPEIEEDDKEENEEKEEDKKENSENKDGKDDKNEDDINKEENDDSEDDNANEENKEEPESRNERSQDEGSNDDENSQ